MVDLKYKDDFYYLYSVVQSTHHGDTCHPSEFLPERLKSDWLDPYLVLRKDHYIQMSENKFRLTPFGRHYLDVLRAMMDVELEYIGWKIDNYHLLN